MKTQISPLGTLRLLPLLFIALLASCGTPKNTRLGLWEKMYQEQPRSILIMPPINNTEHVAAKEYFYSSIAAPLAERGYYVFSPYLTLELLQQESAADAEPFLEGSLAPFRRVLDADAALFTIIKRWDRNVVSSTIRVEVEYILRSTKTDAVLLRRNADIIVDTSVSTGYGILSSIANAIATATTSKIIGARRANGFMLRDIPSGKYAPDYGKDQKSIVLSEDVKGLKVR